MRILLAAIIASIFLVGCGKLESKRYEVKNIKLPYRSIDGINTKIDVIEEVIKVDTRTGQIWKLQHGQSNVTGGELCEFSMWDELGKTYRTTKLGK
ncbi:MAG: hypothetical protein V1933_06745 [Candidatus Omnitrophota bacterium]